MKIIFRTFRFIFITILWSLFYFGLVRKYFLSVRGFGGFDILSKSAWISVYNDWVNGWVLTTGTEHLFFFSVILFLPVWAVALWGFIAFDYIGYVKGKIADKRKRIEKMKAEAALYNPPKVPIFRDKNKYKRRPNPLRALSKGEFKEKPKDKGVDDKQKAKKPERKPIVENTMPDVEDDGILSEEEILSGAGLDKQENHDDLPDFETAKPNAKETKKIAGETIDEILENGGYKVLKSLNVNEEELDYLAVANDKLLVIKKFDDDGQWLADEIPFRDEDPQWFSEVSQKTSPVKMVTNLAEFFDDKIDEKYDIIPVLIVSKANIMNAEEIMKSWDDLHVIVAWIENGGPKDILPEFSSAIMEAGESISDDDLEKIKAIFKK